jgi:hypothetical protein
MTEKVINYGMKVNICYRKDCWIAESIKKSKGIIDGKWHDVLRNVTEIHWNFESPLNIDKEIGKRVAFESDIHGTGILRCITDIEEFETELETKKQKGFLI